MATFDTTPTAKHLIALASQKWTATGAISELVDNSLGKLRGNARKVLIVYDKRGGKILVLDNGVGMDRIGRLFQLGNTIGMGAGDIGKYGSGGTMALLWLPTDVRIWTLRNGKVMRDHVSWRDYENEYPQVNDDWEVATVSNTPEMLLDNKQGTLVELRLRKNRSLNPETVQRDLARLYAPGLRHGKIIQWMTISSKGRDYLQTLHGEPFDLPDDQSNIVRFNIVIEHNNKHLPIKGTVALIDDLSYKDSLVSIGFANRVIKWTRDCYQSPDGTRQYSGTGVGGWLDLGDGWQDYLSTTKDDINDDYLRSLLMHHVFKQIEPLLKKTEEDRLTVILDGIALDLSDALNGLNELNTDFLGTTGAGRPGMLREDNISETIKPFIPFPTGEPIVPLVVDPARKGAYEIPAPVPPATKLHIMQQSDADMNGNLCRMDVLSDTETNLRVEVNKEHDAMKELLKNRSQLQTLGLHLVVTREIAASLSDKPGLMKRLLSENLRRKLGQLTDKQRERALARLLMDSARRPRLDPDAA